MDLRETGKNRRRRQILDAARQLIEAEGRDALSMRRLAESAQLSTRTLYNLYGAKEDILHALMVENYREIDAALARLSLACPLDRSRALVDVGLDQYTSRAALNKALIRALEVGGRPRDTQYMSRTRGRHEAVVAEAMQSGLLLNVTSPRLIAHHIVMAYGQACRMWSREVIGSGELKTQAQHARVLCLLAVAAPGTRARLERELDAVSPELNALVQRFDVLADPTPALVAVREGRDLSAV